MATEILRPCTPVGDEENIDGSNAGTGNHWQDVDEETPDEGATRVYTTNASYQRDFYNIDNHSMGSGTINHITVYARCYAFPEGVGLKIVIKSGTGAGAPDTPRESSEKTVLASWSNFSNQWADNPATTSAWTWDEIDNLQAGISLKEPSSGEYYTQCTQVYVVVDYSAGWAGGDVSGVAIAGIAKINGVALAAITKVNGVA